MVNITEGHEAVRKEILDKMSETIYLDYPLKNAFNEGKAEGKAKAIRKLQTLLQRIPKDSEDFAILLKASGDELEALYKKYNVFSE